MSAIARSIQDRTLLITGATGFLGRALVEKILREVPRVRHLYLLIRPGSEMARSSAAERLAREVIASDVFDRLRTMRSGFDDFIASRVSAVEGDVSREGLGLKPATLDRLLEEVEVIVHCSASVSFDERFDHAIQLNTLGPKRILAFAQECRNRAVLVHVSTSFIHGRLEGRVEEAALHPRRSIRHALDREAAVDFDVDTEIARGLEAAREIEETAARREMLAKFHREAQAETSPPSTASSLPERAEARRAKYVRERLSELGMRQAQLHGWHDVYTFTKAMGEQLLVRDRRSVPIAIIRPSIIEGAFAQPRPGWICGLRMADPLLAALGKGRLRSFPGNPDCIMDIIPVDFVVNAILAAIPRVAGSGDLQVFQVATGDQNPLRLKELVRHAIAHFERFPMRNHRGSAIAVRPLRLASPERFRRSLRLRYQLPLVSTHWVIRRLPGMTGARDWISRRQKHVEQIRYYGDLYEPYVHNGCEFAADNTRRLYEELEPDDRERFDFDVRKIDWKHYIAHIHLPGLRRHVLREPEPRSRVPRAASARSRPVSANFES